MDSGAAWPWLLGWRTYGAVSAGVHTDTIRGRGKFEEVHALPGRGQLLCLDRAQQEVWLHDVESGAPVPLDLRNSIAIAHIILRPRRCLISGGGRPGEQGSSAREAHGR